jgi:hypothetical protein
MGFYKTTIIVAIIHLIVFLAILGVIMSNMKSNKNIFPNEISMCPDFYIYDGSSCQANTNIYTFPMNSSCSKFDLNQQTYKNPGIDLSSGLCNKKNDAIDCNLSWDGITNNSDICHGTDV